MMRDRMTFLAAVLMALGLAPARGQEAPAPEDPHAGHKIQAAPAEDADRESGGAAHAGSEAGMEMAPMQGGSPPPGARDPHAYAEGQDFGPYTLRMADEHSMRSVLVDNLESMYSGDNTFMEYDLQAWYGRTYNRAVLKGEGEYDDGEFTAARTELVWGHAIATFWDTQLGLRWDGGEGPDRGWLSFGVQGLAPYWFEVEATGYLSASGRTALRLDASYDLLLTQKLILQGRVEADFYGKDDARRGLGSGLSELDAALRLRYEIRREFAPYIGVEWAGSFGDTEDFARAAGEDPDETRFVAGLRFWF